MAFVLTAPTAACAQDNRFERWYQDRWCRENGGQSEVVLPNSARCDCVTATHAVEVERAWNWKEAIGQSLHYGLVAKKRAGIVLILDDSTDLKYLHQLKDAIDHYHLPIDVWEVGGCDENQGLHEKVMKNGADKVQRVRQ